MQAIEEDKIRFICLAKFEFHFTEGKIRFLSC